MCKTHHHYTATSFATPQLHKKRRKGRTPSISTQHHQTSPPTHPSVIPTLFSHTTCASHPHPGPISCLSKSLSDAANCIHCLRPAVAKETLVQARLFFPLRSDPPVAPRCQRAVKAALEKVASSLALPDLSSLFVHPRVIPEQSQSNPSAPRYAMVTPGTGAYGRFRGTVCTTASAGKPPFRQNSQSVTSLSTILSVGAKEID
ncbi:hypothetical protein B0J11DRAFT_248513 [Dendryphion nanum]|uniref:Uncharacterized protein n=1 Tax=Dendryphion nanum TaxID=256645 RepID=A0A9P9E1K8_9PLEO|nr:hypothetical protein B0J11DRAFT_248513 [Dendryphion nanum]